MSRQLFYRNEHMMSKVCNCRNTHVKTLKGAKNASVVVTVKALLGATGKSKHSFSPKIL